MVNGTIAEQIGVTMEKQDVQSNGILGRINGICASLSGVILLFITLSIFIDVFLRYFLNSPSIWITEVSSYLFLYVIFLGAAYALQEDLHIRVTFLTDRMPPVPGYWVELLTWLISTVFSVVLLWQVSLMTWESYSNDWTTPTMLGVHYFLIYMSMVIGSGLLVLSFTQKIVVLLISGPDRAGASQ